MDPVTLTLAQKYTDESILGVNGILVGKSAYEIAVLHGFVGSELQWLASIKGDAGETPQFRTNGNVLQIRFPSGPPGVWTDLYEFSEISSLSNADIQEILNNL